MKRTGLRLPREYLYFLEAVVEALVVLERVSIECRKQSLNCFGFALLRSVIGLKTRATY